MVHFDPFLSYARQSVVYHLHGRTGWSTLWANCSQIQNCVKFRPGIAFTICTNRFHLPENDRKGRKLVLQMALKKWNTNFRLEYFVRKNRTTFSDVWNDLKGVFHLLSNRIFRKLFVNGNRQPPFQSVSYKSKITNQTNQPTNQPSFTFLLQSRLRDLTGQR